MRILLVEDDRIKEVAANGRVGALPGPVTTHDLKGATLMPGLTDAHVHFFAVTENITDQHRYLPPSLLVAKALKRAEECLMQGFTTVRDAGGADYGLREALAEGLFPGPRLLVSGNYLSQTGGHGDKRRRSDVYFPRGGDAAWVGAVISGPTGSMGPTTSIAARWANIAHRRRWRNVSLQSLRGRTAASLPTMAARRTPLSGCQLRLSSDEGLLSPNRKYSSQRSRHGPPWPRWPTGAA